EAGTSYGAHAPNAGAGGSQGGPADVKGPSYGGDEDKDDEGGSGGFGNPDEYGFKGAGCEAAYVQGGGTDDGDGDGEEQRRRRPRSDDGDLPAYRSAAVGNFKFEYLDHTADVQLHAWGADLKEAFEQCALAMFNYMSPIKHVRLQESRTYRMEGHDLPSLLYAFLDELLFVFATELFLAASVRITSFDRESFVIEAEGFGETFDRTVHEVGTEIKAITYSAMSIGEREGDAEIFVIVDI
ncbi:hypothetical protein Agub_g4618, partial [Astrephomene gubernaculifera]